MVSIYFDKGKNGPIIFKNVESKLGSRLSQNLVQACCATKLDQVLTQRMVLFLFGGGGIFWKTFSFSLQKEEDKKNRKMRKVGPSFWLRLKKAIFGPSVDSTTYIIYIYVATESSFEGPFLLFRELIPVPLFFTALFCRQKQNES